MRRPLLALSLAVLLSACASFPFGPPDLQLGMSREQVVQRMGRPTAVVPIAGGERLQYSLQPFGQFAWMVDLDGAGRLVRSRQVLNAGEFGRIVPGQWTRDDVLREFGPPARIDRVAMSNGPVFTYRWRDTDRADMFYWVYMDERGVVQRAHQGIEFINDSDVRL